MAIVSHDRNVNDFSPSVANTVSNATRSRLLKVFAKRLKQWGLILLLHPPLKLFLERLTCCNSCVFQAIELLLH